MSELERTLDFHDLGLAIKEARIKKGWTQAYLAELVGRTDRTIMSIENKGQFPSLNVFYQIVTLLDISVDKYFFKESDADNRRRKQIDILLNQMSESELLIIEYTARGIKESKEEKNN